MCLNCAINMTFGYAVLQIFILIAMIGFPYLYSNKNKKYILYGIVSLILNALIQGITYLFKIKLIDFTTIGELTRGFLSIDYFIIMAVIILIKEIYLKKRGEVNE